jgi:hypothetical protein
MPAKGMTPRETAESEARAAQSTMRTDGLSHVIRTRRGETGMSCK